MYCIVFYSILFYCIPLHSFLFSSILFHHVMLWYVISYHTMIDYSTLRNMINFTLCYTVAPQVKSIYIYTRNYAFCLCTRLHCIVLHNMFFRGCSTSLFTLYLFIRCVCTFFSTYTDQVSEQGSYINLHRGFVVL